jgi:hypothetical protein
MSDWFKYAEIGAGMADEFKIPTPKGGGGKAASSKASTPKRSLLPSSESSDPAVHQVLAEIQTARANNSADEVRRLTQRLADLGFE